jgi:hypothetical protein
MYSTCLFCTRPLGANEVVETFPVGRRIAFDPAKGRLWVVCRKCERWNLSPIEERWEALEDLEREFRGTRTRVSTEQIGLARLSEGLELVRIGAPQRPEFAAWRYGDQFGRRRKRAILYGVGGAAVLGGIVIGGATTGILSGAVLSQSGNFVNMFVNARTRVRVKTDDGRVLRLKSPHLLSMRVITTGGSEGFGLEIGRGKKKELFEGTEAERMISQIVPKLNSSGGNRNTVQDAVRQIEDIGSPEAYFAHAIRQVPPTRTRRRRKQPEPGRVALLPKASRLALEMALHEERERRALEGELKLLEVAWREAEEVAAISDDLLLPPGATERIAAGGHRDD